MIRPMRRLLVAFMILLLPLRGLMGDAMATQMSVPALLEQAAVVASSGDHHAMPTKAHSHRDTAESAVASAAHDCFDHASVGQPSSPDVPQCQSCPTCQACSIVALSTPFFAAPFVMPVPIERLQSAVSRFTSADRAPSLKPPIS